METVFDLLEGHYRGKRQTRLFIAIAGLGLAMLAFGSALTVLVTGVDDPAPSYYPCEGLTKQQCRDSYNAGRAEGFASGRVGFGLVPFFPGLIALALWFPIRNKDAPALVRTLRERPHEVVWVHVKQTRYRSARSGATLGQKIEVVVGTTDRKLHEFDVWEQMLERWMVAFKNAVPHATFGYDQEKQAAFFRDPNLLRSAAAPPPHSAPLPQGGPPPQFAGPPQATAVPPQAPPPQGASAPGGLRVGVAPQVPFGHIDHVMRSLGLNAEPPGPPVAPSEPGAAAWSAPWARIVYRFEPAARARSLEIFAQDPMALRARIGASGLPIA